MASVKFSVLARQLSTSSNVAQKVKPPIQLFGLDGRYATALYSAASKTKQLEKVEKELISFQNTIKTDTTLQEFIKNPTLKRNLKVEAMKQITTKIQLSPPTSNLFELLAENGRLKNLNSIINAFKTIMAAHRGEVTCEVVTAKPLDATLRQQLEKVLKAFMKSNESILLNTKIDPSIIGGMIVSIGDRYVDMSVASKIKKYKDIISVAV